MNATGRPPGFVRSMMPSQLDLVQHRSNAIIVRIAGTHAPLVTSARNATPRCVIREIESELVAKLLIRPKILGFLALLEELEMLIGSIGQHEAANRWNLEGARGV